MRLKTIFIVVVAVLLTVVIMQNSGPVYWKILFFTTYTSKLTILLAVAVLAFVVGFLAGRPKRTRLSTDVNHGYDEPTRDRTNDITDKPKNTLSDEDRDYISGD